MPEFTAAGFLARWRSLLALLASNGAAVLEDGLVAWDAGLGGASGG
ncbi:MAG: hypothetical protein ACJ75N_08160 [Actinomycetes bacterium]